MSQVINTNVLSLTAQRNLQTSQSQLATSLQRLSSGLRINSAKDDAAGLAISERFTTQIRGLNQAIRNANDGISLSQTGEAALATVTDNLQRIRELAVQSVNATNSDTDRATLQQEVEQRLNEIDRIAGQTSFNGRNVLDGTFGEAQFQVGANVGQTIALNLADDASVRSSDIGSIATATSVDLRDLIVEGGASDLVLAEGDLTVGGQDVTGSFANVGALATAINALEITGLTATADSAAGTISFSNDGEVAVTIAGDNNVLGIETVAAAELDPIPGTGTISADVFTVTLTEDVTIAGDGVTDATVIGAGTYNAGEVLDEFNAIDGISAEIDADGVLVITNNSGESVTFAGTGDELGINATVANEETATIANTVFEFEVTENDFTLAIGEGTAVSIAAATYNATTLAAAIDVAADNAEIAAFDGGAITITNTTADDFVFAGSQATTLLGADNLTVAAQDPNEEGTPGTATTAALSDEFTTEADPLTISGLTITIGDNDDIAVADGTYSTVQSFVDAVNTALGSNGSALLNAANELTITSGETITIGGDETTEVFGGTTEFALGDDEKSLSDTSVTTVENANEAIARIDAALSSVSELRSTFGAIQNRFESTIENLTTTSENLSASRSRILDADFAAETANLTRVQILQQAGISVLSQANVAPQNVLALLQ